MVVVTVNLGYHNHVKVVRVRPAEESRRGIARRLYGEATQGALDGTWGLHWTLGWLGNGHGHSRGDFIANFVRTRLDININNINSTTNQPAQLDWHRAI
jgi:hypothetical protein